MIFGDIFEASSQFKRMIQSGTIEPAKKIEKPIEVNVPFNL